MAVKKTTTSTTDFSKVAKVVTEIPLEQEVENSFLAYSYMVILARAIGDARDGLKPVHRRVLWSMLEKGYSPDKNHVKSAKIIGQVTGDYHTFGDSACYEAMARLAQGYSMGVPLIDPHGNFGAGPGDSPAASRYTEARLNKAAMLMLADIKEDAVGMRPNYDSTLMEPDVLPTRFPNAIINGGSGIAVGMASNMASHNPDEVMDAAKWLLNHPNATVDKLMEFIPGPDFPTGGEILGVDAIKEAYETGKGIIKIRAKWRINPLPRGKSEIIFYELPFEVSIEKTIEKIKARLKLGHLLGLADVKNLTDRNNGTQLVVESKAGFNVDALLAELLKFTDLEKSFGFNNIVIHEGEPKLMGLKELLQVFIDHRIDVVNRRSAFRKKKKEDRLHLVAGLLKALANIDEVIRIIRAAADSTVAQTNLMKKFKIDEVQADYILSIPLRRLTKFDSIELNNENKKLLEEIKELNEIITDEKVRRQVILKEFDETKKALAQPRRSTLVDGSIAEHAEASKAAVKSVTVEVEAGPTAIGVYLDGSVMRIASNTDTELKAQGRTKLVPVINSIVTHNKGKVVFVTNFGNGYRTDVIQISENKPLSSDNTVHGLQKGERIIAVAPIADDKVAAGVGVFFATKQGTVKITAPDFPVRSDDFDLISLASGDELVTARWIEKVEGTDIVLLSSDSSLLTFPAEKIRPQGRSGAGIAGIKLGAGQTVLAAAALTAEESAFAQVLTTTGTTVKLSPFKLYPAKGRATGGVRSHALLKGESGLTAAFVGADIVAVDKDDKKVVLPAVNQKRDGSGAKVDQIPVNFGR